MRGIYIRRSIAAIFILLFAVLIPLIIIITAGLQYNFKKHKFEKTGLIIIETEPSDALVLLDEKSPITWWLQLFSQTFFTKEYKTPTRLNNIIPREYELTLKRDGYHEWKQRIIVNSGQTTFIENIKLWPNNNPQYTFNNLETIFASKLKEIEYFIWHEQKNLFLLKIENVFSLLDRRNDKITALPTNNIKEAKFDSLDENIIYWHEGSVIKKQSLADSQIQNIYNGQFADWMVNNNEIYVISSNTIKKIKENKIETFTVDDGIRLEKIIYISRPFLFIASNDDKFISLNINTGRWQIVFEAQKVIGMLYNAKTDLYWWWNDFDIGLLDLQTTKNRLITRVSLPIIKLLQIKSEPDIVILITEKKVIALDTQFHKQTIFTNLVEFPLIKTAQLDKDEERLFIISINKDQKYNFWSYEIN